MVAQSVNSNQRTEQVALPADHTKNQLASSVESDTTVTVYTHTDTFVNTSITSTGETHVTIGKHTDVDVDIVCVENDSDLTESHRKTFKRQAEYTIQEEEFHGETELKRVVIATTESAIEFMDQDQSEEDADQAQGASTKLLSQSYEPFSPEMGGNKEPPPTPVDQFAQPSPMGSSPQFCDDEVENGKETLDEAITQTNVVDDTPAPSTAAPQEIEEIDREDEEGSAELDDVAGTNGKVEASEPVERYSFDSAEPTFGPDAAAEEHSNPMEEWDAEITESAARQLAETKFLNESMPPNQETRQAMSEEIAVSAEEEEEEGERDLASLKKVFIRFASFGSPMAEEEMGSAHMAKLCKECDLIDEHFTSGEMDVVFVESRQFRGLKMSFDEFVDNFLPAVAEIKGMPQWKIERRICQKLCPDCSGTKPVAVKLHSEKDEYCTVCHPELLRHGSHSSGNSTPSLTASSASDAPSNNSSNGSHKKQLRRRIQ